MRLQSKKSNQELPFTVTSVFILSLIYWVYLSLTTHMSVVFDSIGYESIGRMIETHGLISYFTSGPNREPLYPLLIAASMHLEHILGLTYTKMMAIIGVFVMVLTQVLTYKILRLLNIRHGICVLVLSYLALSPALNNSAFSLYSEIATYPLVLGILLSSFYVYEAIITNKRNTAFFCSMLLGVLLTLASLVKGVFECIAPVYLIILFSMIFLTHKKNIIIFTLSLITALSFFYAPITGFKWLNWHYNGNFVLTNRGSWLIYGNTERRTGPLTLKKFGADLANVPGTSFCKNFFSQQKCDFWFFQESDGLGIAKQEELERHHLPHDKINSALIRLSAQKALHKPFQYTFLAAIESLKMFFWESTQIGFVDYPHWLQKIYDIRILNNGLRFVVSLLSLVAVLSLWIRILKRQVSPVGLLLGALIFIYIFFFSFVCTLTRYALPIAPLYLIAIGLWMQNLHPKKII